MILKKTIKAVSQNKLRNIDNDILFIKSKIKHTELEAEQLKSQLVQLEEQKNKYNSESKFINI